MFFRRYKETPHFICFTSKYPFFRRTTSLFCPFPALPVLSGAFLSRSALVCLETFKCPLWIIKFRLPPGCCHVFLRLISSPHLSLIVASTRRILCVSLGDFYRWWKFGQCAFFSDLQQPFSYKSHYRKNRLSNHNCNKFLNFIINLKLNNVVQMHLNVLQILIVILPLS